MSPLLAQLESCDECVWRPLRGAKCGVSRIPRRPTIGEIKTQATLMQRLGREGRLISYTNCLGIGSLITNHVVDL